MMQAWKQLRGQLKFLKTLKKETILDYKLFFSFIDS